MERIRIKSAIARMIFIGLAFGLLSNCDGDLELSPSNYIILNRKDGRANISLYDGSNQKLTEQFCVFENLTGSFAGANKNKNFLFVTTHGLYGKLRKIDTRTGTEVKAVNSWIYYNNQINFHNNNIVISYLSYEGYQIKVYDSDLLLRDSINYGHIFSFGDAVVSNNRLFSVVGDANGGHGYILVTDLSTLTSIDSIELSSYTEFLHYRENKLLVFQLDSYFTLNTESLEMGEPIESYIPTGGAVALNASEDVLYYLIHLSQPSMHPYSLGRLDIPTGEWSYVTEYGEPITGPLIYDNKTKVIVSGGGLKIFSRDGQVLDFIEDALPTTWKVFIQ